MMTLPSDPLPAPSAPTPLAFWRWLAGRATRILLVSAAGSALVISLVLYAIQRQMIFMPRPYDRVELADVERGDLRRVSFDTADGKQVAYYVPPRSGASHTAETVFWVMFHGNASLALNWLYFLENYPGEDEAFLLVDYPGYGESEGEPSSDGIRRTVAALLPAAAREIGVPVEAVAGNLCVLGYSIGAAAGLELSRLHPIRRGVFMAPFTTLSDMARRAVGWPLCLLLSEHLDNREGFAVLARQAVAADVVIFHGTADPVVPSSMSGELAAAHPSMVRLHLVNGADHESLFEQSKHDIRRAMTAPLGSGESAEADSGADGSLQR